MQSHHRVFKRALVAGICGAFAACDSTASKPAAHVLSAAQVFDVSAVEAAKQAGFTLSSGVCEVESPEEYATNNGMFGGHLFFHAFRVKPRRGGRERTVLYASNHPASAGQGLVIAVNADAHTVDSDFPLGSRANPPITEQTPGAQDALKCAQFQAASPTRFALKGKDVEEWRREAIRRFGPEERHKDGSKDDYVQLALLLCKDGEQTMRDRLGNRYAGSLQEFVMQTFCPYVPQ